MHMTCITFAFEHEQFFSHREPPIRAHSLHLAGAGVRRALAVALAAGVFSIAAGAQALPQLPPAAAASAPVRVTLDQAIQLALQHNHALAAQRTTIQQSQAQETTANLRPNPTLAWDSQFLPIFSPSNFTADYFKNDAQFDIGLGYTLE